MPELPEVETMRRGVLPAVGLRIVDAARVNCPRKPILVSPAPALFARRTRGRTIVDVARAGKRVLIVLDSGDAIVLEPRMTGLVLVSDPPDANYLRFRIALESASAARSSARRGNAAPREILFWDRRGLGSVRLLTKKQQEAAFGLDALGPDALVITANELAARLGNSRRAIKVALLDQRAVAGVGNLYASELLHLAAVHPATLCNRLSVEQWAAIHAAMLEILHDAIAHEGSTLSDGTYRNALNQSGDYQNHHRVYDRAGRLCGRCAEESIVRIVQAQRATFFCPHCQKLHPARRRATSKRRQSSKR
jgi:formamidopyrimidine-DNA glycosylase